MKRIYERNAESLHRGSVNSGKILASLSDFGSHIEYRYIIYQKGLSPLRPSDAFGEESCQEHAEAAETVIEACQALIAGSDE